MHMSTMPSVEVAVCHMCRFGMMSCDKEGPGLVKKPTRFMSNSPEVCKKLKDDAQTSVRQTEKSTATYFSLRVVRAHVTEIRNLDLRHEGKGFFTDVDLTITEVYRGQSVPERYTMRMIGGYGADGLNLWIPGMPRFKTGQESVLFLERTSEGHIPCGLGQGVWRVRSDLKGTPWVTQGGQGMHLVRRDHTGRLAPAHKPPLTSVHLLQDLVTEIYAAQHVE